MRVLELRSGRSDPSGASVFVVGNDVIHEQSFLQLRGQTARLRPDIIFRDDTTLRNGHDTGKW